MKPRAEIIANPRIKPLGEVGGFEAFELNGRNGTLHCVAGWDEDGWEHVSVSPKGSKREREQPCPTWEQMREAKRAFFRDDETAAEFHPPEGEYFHGPSYGTNILHLWRPADGDWSKLEGGTR